MGGGGGGKELAHLLYVGVDIKDERPRDRGGGGALFVSSRSWTPQRTLWLGAGLHLWVEIWVLHTGVRYVLLCQSVVRRGAYSAKPKQRKPHPVPSAAL